MKVVAFLGSSGSGKTTTIEGMISKLDYKVGTIKFMHHERLDVDPKGKDTRRHIDAGSLFTIGAAKKETVITVPSERRVTFDELKKIVNLLPEVDLLLVESLFSPPSDAGIIVSANDIEDLEKSISRIKEHDHSQLIAIVGRISQDMDNWNGVPCVSTDNLIPLVNSFLQG